MAAKPMIEPMIKTKNEHRFAVTVPDGPAEMACVSKFLPAEPIKTRMTTSCGMNANLIIREFSRRTTLARVVGNELLLTFQIGGPDGCQMLQQVRYKGR